MGAEMILKLLIAKLIATLALLVLFVFVPGFLDVVFDIQGALWTPIGSLLVFILPEPYSTGLWGAMKTLSALMTGAEWGLSILPWYGEEARMMFRLLVHGSAVLAEISLIFLACVCFRAFRKRRKKGEVESYR